jgi:hypothetical protein
MGISQLRIGDWGLRIEECALRIGIGRGEDIKAPFHASSEWDDHFANLRSNTGYSNRQSAIHNPQSAIHEDNQE